MGGEQAFATIDWAPIDVGEGLARKAIQEWLGLDLDGEGVWHTNSEGFAWARAGEVNVLEERCGDGGQ